MRIERLTAHLRACGLYNNEVSDDGLVYKNLEPDDFYEKFFGGAGPENQGVVKVNMAALLDENLIGFASGSFREKADHGFITFVCVDSKHRRKGLGGELLAALEAELRAENPEIRAFRVDYENPVNLGWFLPGFRPDPEKGFKGTDHPNAPGVSDGSDAHKFFLAKGYETNRAHGFIAQDSFYREIQNYHISDELVQNLEDLKEKGLSVCFYDPEKHGGFEELCDNLGSADWRFHLMGYQDKVAGCQVSNKMPEPMLILAAGPRVVGFSGPLRVQESGRGYFTGVAVHSDFRGVKGGKSLFSALCMAFKEMGVRFVTLFTARENFARNIYLAEDFEIVKSWANLRKLI